MLTYKHGSIQFLTNKHDAAIPPPSPAISIARVITQALASRIRAEQPELEVGSAEFTKAALRIFRSMQREERSEFLARHPILGRLREQQLLARTKAMIEEKKKEKERGKEQESKKESEENKIDPSSSSSSSSLYRKPGPRMRRLAKLTGLPAPLRPLSAVAIFYFSEATQMIQSNPEISARAVAETVPLMWLQLSKAKQQALKEGVLERVKKYKADMLVFDRAVNALAQRGVDLRSLDDKKKRGK